MFSATRPTTVVSHAGRLSTSDTSERLSRSHVSWQAVVALNKASESGGVPSSTLELVHLRVSQINGCSACVDSGVKAAAKSGESAERIGTVAAWREAPYWWRLSSRTALECPESRRPFAHPPRRGSRPPPFFDNAEGLTGYNRSNLQY
jgi:AhpD family alkylhydroperoxidase